MKRRLIVRVAHQSAELWEGDRCLKTYRVSTSAYGLGSQEGSLKTPLGRFEIADKIGDAHPHGAIFKARVHTGQIWSASPKREESEDLVLTRILRLRGLDDHNANTYDRYIYLHGTNHEEKLGTPVSHGCVRFSNQDICDVFDELGPGSLVEIVES